MYSSLTYTLAPSGSDRTWRTPRVALGTTSAAVSPGPVCSVPLFSSESLACGSPLASPSAVVMPDRCVLAGAAESLLPPGVSIALPAPCGGSSSGLTTGAPPLGRICAALSSAGPVAVSSSSRRPPEMDWSSWPWISACSALPCARLITL